MPFIRKWVKPLPLWKAFASPKRSDTFPLKNNLIRSITQSAELRQSFAEVSAQIRKSKPDRRCDRLVAVSAHLFVNESIFPEIDQRNSDVGDRTLRHFFR